MPKFRLKIRRTVAFEIDLEGTDRMDVLRKVTNKALEYDDRDHERTEIMNIRELPNDRVCDLSDGA